MNDIDVPRLPVRRPNSHKGDYGRILIIGGSRGMAGAVALSGAAALYAGAGLVRIATPSVCLETVAGFHPCYTTAPLACDPQGMISQHALADLSTHLSWASVVVLGPGMGQSQSINHVVRWICETARCPLILDADGLNAVAGQLDCFASSKWVRVLTPHPGELERLTGVAAGQRDAQIRSAERLANELAAIVVLKGNQSVIVDGELRYTNNTGNASMATGGCGDVLTGVIAALLGQGMEPLAAVRLAVYAHGSAGDTLAANVGNASVLPTELLTEIRNHLSA